MERVIVYVDGMNLYYGLRAKHGRRYPWLDVVALAQALLRPGQRIERVNYFTARVRNSLASQQRQDAYLLALEDHCRALGLVEGRFQERVAVCRGCGTGQRTYEEKETDVNIATAVVRDAALGGYDMALLITADADLCPAIRVARELAPRKRFIGDANIRSASCQRSSASRAAGQWSGRRTGAGPSSGRRCVGRGRPGGSSLHKG